MKVKIDKIIVTGDNPRQIFDEEGLRRLGESIKAHGQIQPILVRPSGDKYELVVGERRVRACALVGLETIQAEIRDLDDISASELRLIENIHRKDLTDAEKGDAVYSLVANYDKYNTIKDVSDAINVPYTTVRTVWCPKSQKLSKKLKECIINNTLKDQHVPYLMKYSHTIQNKLANTIIKNKIPSQKVGDFTKLYDADPKRNLDDIAIEVIGIKKVTILESELTDKQKKKIKKSKENALPPDELRCIAITGSGTRCKKKHLPDKEYCGQHDPEKEKKDEKPFKYKKVTVKPKRIRKKKILGTISSNPSYRLLCGDIIEKSNEIDPNSVGVIITDPPYGKDYLHLYDKLGLIAKKTLKKGGSLIAMSGQSYLPQIINLLGKHLDYNWTVAYLTPGGQSVQLWQRKVNTFWKPLLWYTKGKYEGTWIGDVTKSEVNDNDKRFMGWQQSETGMADIIERFTKPDDLILDPFMGSGTTGYVAIRLGRKFVGIDIDPKMVEIARKRIVTPIDS